MIKANNIKKMWYFLLMGTGLIQLFAKGNDKILSDLLLEMHHPLIFNYIILFIDL